MEEFCKLKRKMALFDIEGLVLAPANIYWHQKGNNYVLISAKGQPINLELINKLTFANKEVWIDIEENNYVLKNLHASFVSMQSELLVRDKKRFRTLILHDVGEILLGHRSDKLGDLWTLSYRLFSLLSDETAIKYKTIDSRLYQRSLIVSSLYTWGLMALGFYGEEYLKQEFTESFISLNDIYHPGGLSMGLFTLEELRIKDELEKADLKILRMIYGQAINRFIGLSERYTGDGPLHISIKEMSDQEKLFLAINRAIPFVASDYTFNFKDISDMRNYCDKNIFLLIENNFLSMLKEEVSYGA